MGADSKIQWTDHTFNPWWGCTRIAPACDHCYAEAFANMLGKKVWGAQAPRRFFGPKHWNEPEKWNKEAAESKTRRRVFCASMADVCEDRDDLLEPRSDLMRLIERTPWLDWLLLTKRPENFNRFFSRRWGNKWPSNIVAMATAENQARLDFVVNELAEVPAERRGLSLEPLLENVSLRRALSWSHKQIIHWAIIGGESGHHARPFCLEWALSLVYEASALSVAPFVKQLGLRPYTTNVNVWDFPKHTSFSSSFNKPFAYVDIKLKDKHGGDWAEWPDELKVRGYYDPVLTAAAI